MNQLNLKTRCRLYSTVIFKDVMINNDDVLICISFAAGALLQFTERLGELCRTHPNAATLP